MDVVVVDGFFMERAELVRRMSETAVQECVAEIRQFGRVIPNAVLMTLATKFSGLGAQA